MAGTKNRSGRPLDEGSVSGKLTGIAPITRQAHRELFEAFCCAQIERIQQTLDYRYGHPDSELGQRNFLLPQNDHFTRRTLLRDARHDQSYEIRGSIGYQGAKCGDDI